MPRREDSHQRIFGQPTQSDVLAGGARRGAAIQPGKPDESVLIKTLQRPDRAADAAGRQPLSDDKIAALVGMDQEPAAEVAANRGPSKWWAFTAPKRGAARGK